MSTRLVGSQPTAMSNLQVFQAQLASIMEVLANAAVAEICKLVDNDYAVLNLQMSQCQHENKDLKRRLHELELKVAREQAEKRLSVVNSNSSSNNNNNNNNNNNKTISSSCGSPPPVNVHCVSAGASHVTQVDLGLWQSSEASEDSDVEATHSRAAHRDAHEEQHQQPGAAALKEEITQDGGEDDTDMEVALGLLKQEEGGRANEERHLAAAPSRILQCMDAHKHTQHHHHHQRNNIPTEMHLSVWSLGIKPDIPRCTTCCRKFHCPLCPGIKPLKPSILQRHIRSHLNHAIHFQDKLLCRCSLSCRRITHFHCPLCGKTIIRRSCMVNHVKLCAAQVDSPSSPLTSPEDPPDPPLVAACSGLLSHQKLKTALCSYCGLKLLNKNLQTHISRRHSDVTKDDT